MPRLPKTISFYLVTFSLVCITCVYLAIYKDSQSALSSLGGGLFGILLFALMDIAARGFLQKKSVAIAGSVIVFKYAILGIILYFAMNSPLVHQASFMIGFLCFVPGTIVWVLKSKKHKGI